jgi:hypothetical protein
MANAYEYRRAQRNFFTYLAKHLALGVAMGWLVLTAILIIDVGGLRSVALSTQTALIVFPVLYILFAITFGSAGMGIGVMSLGQKDRHDDEDTRGGGRNSPILRQLIPAVMPVRGRDRT